MKHMVQTKRHDISAVTNTRKQNQYKTFFQKALYAYNDSTPNYKSIDSELEIVSSSSASSFPASEVHLSEELHQDMQRFKNEIGTSQSSCLWKERKFNLQKRQRSTLLLLLFFLFSNYRIHSDFPLKRTRVCIQWNCLNKYLCLEIDYFCYLTNRSSGKHSYDLFSLKFLCQSSKQYMNWETNLAI